MPAVSPMRAALASVLSAMTGPPPLLSKFSLSNTVPTLEFMMPHDAFNERKKFDSWFSDLVFKAMRAGGPTRLPIYRSVENAESTLARVLETGIDVAPSDAVFWANSLEKALEYGGDDKIVMVLDPLHLSRSYEEVAADVDKETIARLEEKYGRSPVRTDDGRLWYSRLPEDDPRRGTAYEAMHAWFVPDPAQSPLCGIVNFLTDHGFAGSR
jgi:hypothetical protein